MKPKVLKNEREHQQALKKVEKLWDAPTGSPQAKELDLWASLVEAYEQKHHPIPENKGVRPIDYGLCL